MFGLPGSDLQIRLFESVKTEDTQYNIVDVGVQYKNGGIDSLVFGGSFYTINNLCGSLDEKKAQEEEAVKTAAATTDALAEAMALVKKLAADKETADSNVVAAKNAEVITEATPASELQTA